jgi:two-component system cell cycle sensor histidine kinase/response regulator CckA
MDRPILAALDKAPATVVLLRGPELRYEWMNELYRQILPRVKVGDLFGLQTAQALQFRQLAERVFNTGEPARQNEVEVEMPTGGEQGAEIFKLRASTVDAVVLDLTMPHLSGEETLALLRAIDPAVRVVFFSGYAENELAARLDPLHPAAVLHKPFTRQQLAAALQTALA